MTLCMYLMALILMTHCLPQVCLEPLVIPYQANQPADPQLWDDNFSPISLFGIDKFLTSDAKNIVGNCSLLRIAAFIKQDSQGHSSDCRFWFCVLEIYHYYI